jgi:hypothetical protein
MPANCSLWFVGALTVGLAVAPSSFAQRPGAGNGAERENVRIEGELEDLGAGLLKVKDAAGESYLVKIEADAKNVFLSGKAEAGFLSRGMLVRFTAVLNKKGEVVEPLREITVFTPREGEQPGVAAEQSFGGGAASGIFSDPADEPAKPKKPSANETKSYRVVGVLAGQKNGKLQIAAGAVALKASLADDARISVDVADLRLAKKGDKVSIDGWRYPAQKQQVVATRVSITAAAPLVGGKPKRPVRTPAADKAPEKP